MYFVNPETASDERYDMAKFIEFSVDVFDITNSYFIYKLKQLTQAGTYIVQTEEKRVDLVSYKIYGSTQFWWVILLYNDYLNAEDIASGDNIYYPSIESIEALYFELKSLETAQ